MKEKLTIVKVGGAILEDQQALEGLVKDFSQLQGYKILVHGGGRLATFFASRLGVETKMNSGRRITDEKTLEIVTMVYAGLVNKRVVAHLQASKVNALGLTGADINIITSHKREVGDIDYGFVGDVDRVDSEKLSLLIENGITPVIAPLTHDCKGLLLNTNADTIASEVAKALSKMYDVTLIFCFEKEGVLKDQNNEDSLIPLITPEDFEKLSSQGIISDGMLPKIENALKAIASGVSKVNITKVTKIDGLHGTMIVPSKKEQE